jgi:hypothetical protein
MFRYPERSKYYDPHCTANQIRGEPMYKRVLFALVITTVCVLPARDKVAKGGCFIPDSWEYTFYGWANTSEGDVCWSLFGPPVPPDVVGQYRKLCDGTYQQWGIECFDNPLTEYHEFECQEICD